MSVEGTSVWARVMAELAATGDRLATAMAARAGGAPATDVYATLLGALMDSYLNRYSADPDHPRFLPSTGYYQRLGSPNPDTVYRRAPIDPTGEYRITGRRGAAADVSLMPFDATMRGGAPLDLDEVTDADGGIDLVVGPRRRHGHDGPWWPLQPTTASLWLRATTDRWGPDADPRLAITRIDRPPSGGRSDEAELEGRLAGLAAAVARIVEYGVSHVDELVTAGHVNRLVTVDYSTRGAMPGQWYHEGVFELDDDEALVVELTMPPGWRYFSWSLTDSMLVTLDWVHAQTSLNRSQASVDPDGVLRVVLSRRDPGIRNWMDTRGHAVGVLQCRTIGCTAQPTAVARVVRLESLRDHLPDETPHVGESTRAEDLAARAIGFQLRSLW